MNKKEANEIKKLFTPANRATIHICGCYVDAEKNKKIELKKAFLSLPEEGAFKYFTIFRNALSDMVGENLINAEFPLHTEAEGGTHHLLAKLRDSQLKDDRVLEEFYDKVIVNCDYGGDYCIMLIHCAYDIPAEATGGMEMFDASECVYESIQYTICPIKLAKAGPSYNPLTNAIENRSKDWLAEASDQEFLLLAFNDKNMDIRSFLHYSENPEQIPEILIDELLGCTVPMSAKSQKEIFQAIVEETLGENRGFETVKITHENLAELAEETKGEPVPLTLDKYQVEKLLETNGVTPKKLEEFEQRYARVEDGPGTSFVATSVVSTKSLEIKTPDVSVKVVSDKTYLMGDRMIEGRPCIVTVINEHVEINGISMKPVGIKRPEEEWIFNQEQPISAPGPVPEIGCFECEDIRYAPRCPL